MAKTTKSDVKDAFEAEYDAWLKSLGRTLAEIRTARKSTQKEMAKKTGFDMKYYQDLEYGRRPITTRTLFQLCHGIGMSLQDIINLAAKNDASEAPKRTRGRTKTKK